MIAARWAAGNPGPRVQVPALPPSCWVWSGMALSFWASFFTKLEELNLKVSEVLAMSHTWRARS